jgi:hypothetical protein
MTISAWRILRFGFFEANLQAGELRKQGLKVRLQDQPFQILAMLLERPGELVTRQEIQAAWPANTFVDPDHGLTTPSTATGGLATRWETPGLETLPRKYRSLGG